MTKKHIQAVFLDRDGTIGGDDTVHYPGQFKLFPVTSEAIDKLHENDLKVFSFTNQPGIAAGEAMVRDFIDELEDFGFDCIFICPHGSNDRCKCRKPGTGMLKEAEKKHGLELTKCVVIGDRWTDIAAASQVGSIRILVKTGAGKASLVNHYDNLKAVGIDYIAEDLKDAVKWLFENFQMAVKRSD